MPVAVKDNICVEARLTTCGSKILEGFKPPYNATVIENLRREGAVVLGRANMDEFAFGSSCETSCYGPTRNPWDLSRSAGGSSGGAAAAVAAGIVPLAQGSDGGGSIRIPASATGLFGLKPSRGRNPRSPGTPIDYVSVEHALTRTVRDSAAFLDAVHGPVPGDRYWAPPPSASFARAVPRDPDRLRIAFSTNDFRGDRVHPECEAAILETATLLERLGHDVVEAEPNIDGSVLADAFLELWAALAATGFDLVLDGATRLKPNLGHVRRYAGDRRTMRLISRFDQRESGKPAFEPFTFELAERSG